MKHKKLFIFLAAMAMGMLLSACGGDDTTQPQTTVSPSPSAQVSQLPETTPGSIREENKNAGDVTEPDNSVMPGDNHDSTREEDSRHEDGSSAGEDLKRAGEDIGSAVENVGDSVVDAIDGDHTTEKEETGAQ